MQKRRKCHEPTWNNTGAEFPIRLIPDSTGHTFCPAKLFRDDPGFVYHLRYLWLSWKMGLSPEGDALDTISEETASTLSMLIQTWEDYTRANDFRLLGQVLGGK